MSGSLLGGGDGMDDGGMGLLGQRRPPRWADGAGEMAMLFAALAAPPHQRGQALQQAIAANAAAQDQMRQRQMQEAQLGRQNQREKAYQRGIDAAGIPEHLRPLLRGMPPEQAARILPGILDQAAYDRANGTGGAAAAGATPPASMPRMGGAAPSPTAALGRPAPAPTGEDEDMMARTIIGEAGNQGPEGMAAVAHVIGTRSRLTGQSPSHVVLAPNQFEPWQTRRAELMAIRPDDPRYVEARRIARAALAGELPDPTQGATHFLNADIVRQRRGGALPAWAEGEGRRIGAHTFYARPGDFGGQAATPTPAAATGGPPPARDPMLNDAQGMAGVGGATPRGPRGDPSGTVPGMGPADFIAEARRLQARAQQLRGGGAIGRAEAEQLDRQAMQLLGMAQRTEPPLSVEDRIRIAREGRTNVTQNAEVRGENRYEQDQAADLSKRVTEWTAAGPRASMTEARLRRFEELNNRYSTGSALAGARLSVGAIAQQLGVGNGVLEALGMGRDTIATGEGIRSMAAQILMGQLGPGGFPTNNFSNVDREQLERALPGLRNTRDGNRIMANILRMSVERDREVATAWRDWQRQHGRTQASAQRFELERLPEITERNMPELTNMLDALPGGEDPVRPVTGPAAPVAPAAGTTVSEGMIIRNPQTGQRRAFRNGAWVDVD